VKEKVKWTINDFSYSKRIQLWGIGKALAGWLCALIFWMSASMLLHGVDSFDENHSVFETHCIKCHGKGGKVKGKVNLQELKSSDAFSSNPELLETLIKVLKDREMPPEDEPPLPEVERKKMVAWLEDTLRESLKNQPFLHTPIRRMNRFQYNNAVVDLLELDREIFRMNERLMRRRDNYFKPETRKMPEQVRISSRPLSKDIDNQRPEGFKGVASFPQDKRAEHGYDNRADHLTLSPLLMESFLNLSQTISESPDLNPKECRSWPWLFASLDGASEDNVEGIIRSRLTKLLRRAFRGPVDPVTLDRFVKFALKQNADGESLENTMRSVIGVVLGMPDFLYFYEAPPGQSVNDFELASRLALFFWSSIPDDLLLDLAEQGKLSDPKVLSSQIDRMLNDRRASRFCDNFPAQWLQLDRLITSVPDPEKFAYFYLVDGYRTSMHMMPEPLLLFETIFIEDRPIMELLDPKYTWENAMLRANYAGHAKAGHDVVTQLFKRVPLSDPRRGGVITNAAIMTMTATPTRTQPITRGAWVNAVIFNEPPEPPPADVPPLPEANTEELAKLTIRERLAAHREREDCAGCHNKIDPMGFALENYGPTGVWRDKYENGRDVDVSGVLFNQHDFKTFLEFKQFIIKEKHRFVRGFISHLLSYALSRELGPADSPALDKMTAQALEGQGNMRSVLKSIAMSEPFLRNNKFKTMDRESKDVQSQ
jgi:mono/diheme cytochrome c family protein